MMTRTVSDDSRFLPLIGVIALLVVPAGLQAQEVIDVVPDEDVFLRSIIREAAPGSIVRLAPGLYELEEQLRFDSDNDVIVEGASSGFGEGATVLDFTLYNATTDDARALSVRGPMRMRHLTIRNAQGRVADLRTGNIDGPSDAVVEFEDVWFINCNTVFKSTGGRTVGTPESPMLVKNCVLANAGDSPFPSSQQAITLRDTSYAHFVHCDIYNFDDLVSNRVNDAAAAPNDGPGLIITNSILVAANGSASIDLEVSEGELIIENSVLWEADSRGELDQDIDVVLQLIDTVTADPLYVNVIGAETSESLDVNLQPGSPGIGLGDDGRNAGSRAAAPSRVEDWEVY